MKSITTPTPEKGADTNADARQRWLKTLKRESDWEIRVALKIAEMGTRYLFHPANRVKRASFPCVARG